MSAGRHLYSQIIQVEIGDVIKLSVGCNQFATGSSTTNRGWGIGTRTEETIPLVTGRCYLVGTNLFEAPLKPLWHGVSRKPIETGGEFRRKRADKIASNVAVSP